MYEVYGRFRGGTARRRRLLLKATEGDGGERKNRVDSVGDLAHFNPSEGPNLLPNSPSMLFPATRNTNKAAGRGFAQGHALPPYGLPDATECESVIGAVSERLQLM